MYAISQTTGKKYDQKQKVNEGGGIANLSSTKTLFKPLIASSLALTLGVSVASATTPTLCFSDANCSDQSSAVGIKWESDSATVGSISNQKFYQPQLTSGSTAIESLIINLGGTQGNTTSGTITTGSNFLNFNSGDRGIQLGASGSGTLRINTAGVDGSIHNTNTTLVFNKESSSKYALQGNLEIWGGKDTTRSFTTNEFDTNPSVAMAFKALSTFSVTFKGDLKGDLIVRNQNYRNNNNYGTKGTITFENNAGIEGDLKLTHDNVKDCKGVLGVGLTQGQHTITFGNKISSGTPTLTTNITGSLIFEFGENTINFYNNAVIGKQINAGFIGNENTNIDESYNGNPTQVNRISQNIVTFYGTAEIGGSIETQNKEKRNVAIKATGGSSNTIDFKNEVKVKGDILTCTTCLGGGGVNTLTFRENAEINGNIWGFAGKNEIVFEKNAVFKTLTDTSNSHTNDTDFGSIKTVGTSGGTAGNNIITFNGKVEGLKNISSSGSQGNFITFNNASNSYVIGGEISSSGSGNKIIAKGDLTIQGNITAYRDKNKIWFQKDATINGEITSRGSRNLTNHNNEILFSGNNITIGAGSKKSKIQVINRESDGKIYDRASNNTLIFEGTTSSLNLSNLYVNGDNWNSNSPVPRTFNLLSFNKGTTDSKLGATYVAYGSNIIGKNLATKDGGYNQQMFGNGNVPTIQSNFLDFFTDNAYMANGNFVFDSITAETLGKNYFNVEKATINGDIVANNGGENIINISGSSLNLGKSEAVINITAKNGGANASNTITANNLTAYIGNIEAGRTGWAYYANTITANTGNINIASISAIFYNNEGQRQNTPTNTITLKSGTLNIGSITSSSGYGRIIGNFFNLGENGKVAASVTGDVSTTENGARTVFNLSGNESTLTFGGNISTTNNGAQTNISLVGTNSTLTLNGKTTGGTNHEITSLNTSGGNNTLTLDNSTVTDGAMTTKIHEVKNGGNLTVVFKGQSGKGATLELDNAVGTTLKAVTLGASAQGNTLAFQAGANKILNAVNVEASKKLIINLSGTSTSLHLGEGYSKSGNGEANIKASSGSATLTGGNIDASTLTFENNTSLALSNGIANFANVDSSAGNATLTLNGNNNDVNVDIASLKNGNNLTLGFSSGDNDKAVKIKNVDTSASNALRIKEISLNGASINNTLDLSELNSAVKNITITDKITVGDSTNRQGFTLKVKGQSGNDTTTLTFTDGFATDNGVSTLSLGEGNTTLETTNNDISVTNLDVVGSGSAKVTFKSNTTIETLTAQASGSNTLELNTASSAIKTTIGTTSSTFGVIFNGNNKGTLEINGGTNTISSISFDTTNNGKGELNLSNTNTKVLADISASGSTKTLDISLDNTTLSLGGKTNTITSLKASNGGTIDLSSPVVTTTRANAPTRKTLTIGSSGTSGAFSGNLNAIIFASRTTADKIVIDGTGSTGSITISAKGDINEIVSITYDPSGSNNVQVAEIKNSSTNGNNGTNNIAVQGGESYIGGVLTVAEIVEGTNADEGKYYIGKIEDRGLAQPYQEIANTALTVNYDLYLANFNSINKRMGELRDNPNNQGVWARVFGGNMSNDFGVGSKTDYITAQAGYDYALTLGNAKNYVGVTVAYGKSWTKSNDVSTGNIINGVGTFSLDKVDSNMVEVGIYNSYVEDSGWYNDSILKFDYIMSEFSLSNDPTMSKTNNFAMILSNEVGYRYKFAENEKGNWYIDPQVEIAFGYFNQSDFNRAIFDASQVGTDVSATQDSILTLRSRAGLSLGKKFVTEKGFASIYVGASYEYDYINGGDSSAGRVGGTVTQLDKVESNGRAIVNVGSNIGLSESARLYIDVEKSFGDKQRTFMQFNFGARYSF